MARRLKPIEVQKLPRLLPRMPRPRERRRITFTYDPDEEQEFIELAPGVVLRVPKRKKRGRPASSPQRDHDIAITFYRARAKGSRSDALAAVRRSVLGAAVLSDARLLRIAQQNRDRTR